MDMVSSEKEDEERLIARIGHIFGPDATEFILTGQKSNLLSELLTSVADPSHAGDSRAYHKELATRLVAGESTVISGAVAFLEKQDKAEWLQL